MPSQPPCSGHGWLLHRPVASLTGLGGDSRGVWFGDLLYTGHGIIAHTGHGVPYGSPPSSALIVYAAWAACILVDTGHGTGVEH